MSEPITGVNLLPTARRARRVRKKAVTNWAAATLFVTVGALAPAGAMALASGGGAAEIVDRTRRAERSLQQLQTEEPVLRRRIAELQRTDRVLKVVEDRADWRPLLHALSESAGGARFERIDARITQDGEVRASVITLVASLTEARDLVLRLESCGVFDSVTLSNSARVQLANAEVVRCEIEARFRIRAKP